MYRERSGGAPLRGHSDRSGSAIRDAARQYVGDGEGLSTFLGDLEAAFQVLNLPPPGAAVVKEASLAWAAEILSKYDGATDDPLTGMSTSEHARAQLCDWYGPGDLDRREWVIGGHALVVVSIVNSSPPALTVDSLEEAFHSGLRLAGVGEAIRTTFESCDLVASLPNGRVLAVVGRDRFLESRAEELGWLLRGRLRDDGLPRVAVHAMPWTQAQALALLDQLSI